mgnify:CR=1 FL=1
MNHRNRLIELPRNRVWSRCLGGRWTNWPLKKNLSEFALDTSEKLFFPAGIRVFNIEAD